ncbi:MAG: fibronectin type III domain-containing protein [Cyclobacteriaceae bacterium]|nr:fibronectin type III domain-containing protein [Cyclobacteriaceae bacterium]
MKEFLSAVLAFTLLFSPAIAQPPDPPVLSSPTAIGQTAFTANWNSVAGAVDYRLDVSVSNDFSTRLAGYDNLTVTGTSKVVTGLDPGTAYYYQVRASNGSQVSSNSIPPMQAITLPGTPVANAANPVMHTYFQANWSASVGATWYLLDVSADGFATLLPGYGALLVVGTSKDILGLSPSTQYQYRVRAVGSSGESPNSSVITVLTLPAPPTALAASSVTPTSFVANWSSSSGAIDYRLDVSVDNFESYIPGFQDLTVAGTSQSVTGLPWAVSFQYRVRARNAAGTSANSNVVTLTATQASNITFSTVLPTFMSVNFTNGAGQFRLLVAKAGSPVDALPVDGVAYTPNSTFGSGSEIGSGNFVVWQGNGPATIDNLAPFTTYHFRVFEYAYIGSGPTLRYNVSTAVGNPASQKTMAEEPPSPSAGLTFSSTTTTSTFVTVAAAPGNPTGYLVLRRKGFWHTGVVVDGTTYTVGPFGDGEIVYIGPAGPFIQPSLTSNSEYFFTAFSYNGSGSSVNYNTWFPCSNSHFTLPDPPLAQDPTNTATTFFDANWQAPSGTGSMTYQIDVSDNGFTSVLQNLTSSTTTVRVEGLTPSKDYQYRVRAVNATGPSANSNAITVQTLTPPALAIATAAATTSVPQDFQQSTQTVTVTGGLKPITVVMKHRPIASTTFSSLATSEGAVADTYTATITSAMMDELGVEFFFEATDNLGTVAVSDGNSFLYRVVPSLTTAIPFSANFDGTMESYQMFSVPYILDDKTVASVFTAQGAPDKTKWRLLRYQGGKYIEYPDNITNIDIGKGYWFNTIAKTDIPVGLGSVLQASQSTPFTIPLEKGWNQIGNPFPFNIDWSIIRNLPANAGIGLNSLWTFANGSYVNTTGFKSWSAGFVFSDNGGTLTIPVTSRCTGCRTAAEQLTAQIDDPAWQVPLVLELNGKQQMAAFGMHPEAKESKDAWDEITVPRFLAYLEMNTEHPEFFAPQFTVDMKPTAATAAWPFKVSSSDPSGRATLRWDASALEGNSSSLALLDGKEGFLIDMKATSEYSFSWTEGKQLKVLFDRDGRVQPGITLLGNAYPNPFSGKVSFPILLEKDQQQVHVLVYDLMGRRIKTLTRYHVQAGMTTLEWDGQREGGGETEAGIYLYQLVGDQGMLALPKRMIKH